MLTEELKPWGDDVALRGPDAPKDNGQIEHLIQYLLTVHKRFGNTCVTTQLQWGATALWKRDEQAEKIVELEKTLTEMCNIHEEREAIIKHLQMRLASL